MMIVVEGPDGSGKSTLVESLRIHSHHYFIILRASRAPTTREDMLRYMSWSKQKPLPLDILMDRHPAISEMIYGPLIRQQNRLKDFDSESGREALLKGVTHIIYCRPITPVIEATALKTWQMDGVKEKITDIIQQYDWIMAELLKKFSVFHYDYNKDSVESLIGRIWNGSAHLRESVRAPVSASAAIPENRGTEPSPPAQDPT